MSVDRCICRNVLFRDLLVAARATGADLARLQEDTAIGTGCGMCVPYAMAALRTGKPRVPVMSDAEFDRLLGAGWREDVLKCCGASTQSPA